MKKFKFHVGINKSRTVTVKADTLEEADELAREKLDKIAMKNNEEAPVRWQLSLYKTE